jgi:hypothetical protein
LLKQWGGGAVMLNLEAVNKIAERIKNSERFDENWTTNRIYYFDHSLTIEHYNNLYKIVFKGQTLGHLLSRGDDETLHDVIYYAIQNKKKALKENAFSEL